MLILEIAGGIVLGVLILLFLAYWLWAGLTGRDGAGYCCMIALAAGAWFFSIAIGIAVTGLVVGLFALIALREWVDSRDTRSVEQMIDDYSRGK